VICQIVYCLTSEYCNLRKKCCHCHLYSHLFFFIHAKSVPVLTVIISLQILASENEDTKVRYEVGPRHSSGG
jgi:hypothetical protein